MRKYLFVIVTATVVMCAALAVVAGYPGKFFKNSPEEVPVSASQAMLDLQRHHFSAGKMMAEGKIELFDKNNTAAPKESMQFRYCVSGNKFYQQTGPVEMVNDKEYAVYVHHDKQIIQLGHAEDLPARQLFAHAAIIDSLLRNNKMDATVQQHADGLLALTINQPGGEQISTYRIIYDPKDFTIKKIEMDVHDTEGEDPELIVITYDKLSQQIDDEETIFSVKKFVTRSRKTFALASEFNDYQLINLIPDK
jgi:hypothetical protein